jgi:hypothetical protein
MLSDSSTLALTLANANLNADLDAIDLELTPLLQHSVCSATSSSFSFDITPMSSLSLNKFFFTPTIGILTPPFSSYYIPDFHPSDTNTVLYAVSYSKLASGSKSEFSFDPIMGFCVG